MLETVKPREQAGRDAFGRFRLQAKSAAIAALSILEGGEVDRVYCDMHDDFVVRVNRNGLISYVFYQVKTNAKQNHNWGLNEIFGLSSKIKILSKHENSRISNSFAGKLLQHTVNFGDSCEAVIFQTNINIDDPLETLMKDINSSSPENKLSILLAERFQDCFCCEELEPSDIYKNLQKLHFDTDVQHLKINNNDFRTIAKEAIYNYSEIELTHFEFKDILIKLVELMESKSEGVINELTKESIETCSGVSISDLLEVLSISKAAYEALVSGGDPFAIKNASIIQRTLQGGGANDQKIEFCTLCKIQWDEWLKDNRHILPEIDLQILQEDLSKILQETVSFGHADFSLIGRKVKGYLNNPENSTFDLNDEIILGGVLAQLVRMQR